MIQIQFSHFLKVGSLAYHLATVLNKGVSRLHYVFDPDIAQGSFTNAAERTQTLGHELKERTNTRRAERLRSLKKYDNLVGSKIGSLGAAARGRGVERLNIGDSDW